MSIFKRIIRCIIALPLAPVVQSMDDVDMDELTRAVERRAARAEAAVIRDYCAQRELSDEEAGQVADELRARRREAADGGALAAMRTRAEKAEAAAQDARTSAEALVQMARMGVPESCTEDVLLLTSAQLKKTEDRSAEGIREAVSAVIARLPGLSGQVLSTGSRGSFPRQDDGAAVWQHQLDRARASGDNAAAVGIITAAAEKGIALR